MKKQGCGFRPAMVAAFLFFLVQAHPVKAQNFAFQPGEKVTYSISYRVIGIYINAGSVAFSASKTDHPSGAVYHFVGEGSTNARYDWIFKVRDRYESYFDTTMLQPIKAIRSVSEGKYKKYEEVLFDRQNNFAATKKGNVKIPDNVQDVISSVYYMRNIDFTKYKTGDKIPFNMFFGHAVYNLHVRYQGKEIIKTGYGAFTAIKVQPMLLKGDTFREEDDMTIWITDDKNHLPLRIESKLKVGSIKADLSGYQNLRYPLSGNAGK